VSQPPEQPFEAFVPPTDETFRAMFENAAFAVALVDAEGHCLLTNPALHRWLGYSSDELARMSFVDFTYPEDVALDWELYQELLAGKRQVYTIEKRYYTRHREIVWGRITVSLVAASPSRPLYAVALVEDITERKRAHLEEQAALSALRQGEERLRIATQAGHIGIFDWDLRTGNVTWSGALEGLFGLAQSSFPATFDAFQALVHPDDRPRVVARVMEARTSGKPYAEEVVSFTPTVLCAGWPLTAPYSLARTENRSA
jgi:diguanylate cyclase